MWRSLFFDEFEGLQPAVLLKLDLVTGAFQGFHSVGCFKEQLFLRSSLF